MDNPVQGQAGVVPVAVWNPDANQKYQITPERVYYTAYGDSISRLQAAVTDLGTPVKIDFTGKTETNCSVDLTPDFSWSDPPFSP
jgi:hypothetical protein